MNIVTVTQIYPFNNTYHIYDFMQNYFYPPPTSDWRFGKSARYIRYTQFTPYAMNRHCILYIYRIRSPNQRLPGACNRSPGSKLLSITTELHCGGHLGGRVQLPDTTLEKDHPMTIPSKFGSNW